MAEHFLFQYHGLLLLFDVNFYLVVQMVAMLCSSYAQVIPDPDNTTRQEGECADKLPIFNRFITSMVSDLNTL